MEGRTKRPTLDMEVWSVGRNGVSECNFIASTCGSHVTQSIVTAAEIDTGVQRAKEVTYRDKDVSSHDMDRLLFPSI